MNLQCPTCLKPLTVPDQYAGQMMKCPLCGNTFSVPATGGAGEGLPPLPSLPPAAPTPPTPGPSPLHPISTTPPVAVPPARSGTPTSPLDHTNTPVPSSAPTDGYSKNCIVYFSPEVMRWFAPVAVVLIFLLQFTSWVGYYPGGVTVITQGPWYMAFGMFSEEDEDFTKVFFGKEGVPANLKPDMLPLMLFYVLLFLPTLLLTVAVLLIDLGLVSTGTLPPNFQPLLRWRWAAVAGLNTLVFVLLGLQMVLGTSLESKNSIEAADTVKKLEKTKKEKDIALGINLARVCRTITFWAAFWLHVLAVIGSVTTYCLRERPGKPIPRMELSW